MTAAAFAPVRSSVHGSAGLVRVAGVATAKTLRAAHAEAVRCALKHDLNRVLIDCSGAVIVMDGDEWCTFKRERVAERHELALGYLVGAEAAENAQDYATSMNNQGQICLAFLTRSSAYRWAALRDRCEEAGMDTRAMAEASRLLGRLGRSRRLATVTPRAL